LAAPFLDLCVDYPLPLSAVAKPTPKVREQPLRIARLDFTQSGELTGWSKNALHRG